jgi:hypothetical protein
MEILRIIVSKIGGFITPWEMGFIKKYIKYFGCFRKIGPFLINFYSITQSKIIN